MNRSLPILVCIFLYTSALAENVGIKKEQLVFPIAVQHIAEFAAANAKLGRRYKDDVVRSGEPNYRTAYVSSIMSTDNRKYIFVGFPIKRDVSHKSIIQYCDHLDMYVFEEYGTINKGVDEVYEVFKQSNNTALSGLNDVCAALYKLNFE